MALPTLPDLKAHLNITSTANDDELTEMLDAAVELVESIVGPLATGTVTETHYGLSSDTLVLRQFPATAITAVSSRVGATTTALTLGDYELDATTGIVRFVNGSRFSGGYTVTYTVGRDTLPASIRLAILIIAAHLWETQRGTSPSPLALQQLDVDAGTTPVGIGYAVPARARELLAPYVTPTVA